MFYKRNNQKNECTGKLNFLSHTGLLVCLGFFLLQDDFEADLNNPLHNIVSLDQIYLSNEVYFIRTFITLFEHSGVKDQKAIFLLSCSQNRDFFSEVKQCFFKFPVLDVSSIDESSLLCWNSNTRIVPHFENF